MKQRQTRIKLNNLLHVSLIANTLYLSKDIEKWGSGLKRIYEACKEANVKVEFKKIKSGFVVAFYRREKKDLEKDIEKEMETELTYLSDNQKRVLLEIKKNPKITQKDLSVLIGINEKNIRNNIFKLKQKGLLKRIGPDKGGYWEIE